MVCKDAWDDCYDEPCKHKEYNWHLWIRLRHGQHTIKCAVCVSWTQGMTLPDDQSHTAQLEISAMEGGNVAITDLEGRDKENKTASLSLPPWAALI